MSGSDKLKQVEALKNGKGIQYLLNSGYKIFGNPLYIHDTDYKLVAHTEGIVTDDFLWNELVTTGTHGKDSIELFKNEDFIEDVANSKTVTLLSSDKIKYDRVLGKISNKENIMVACTDIVACKKPFASDDTEAFLAFCGIIAKELSRNDYYQIYGEQYQENIIRDLIDGSIRDKRLYARRVSSLYEGLKNNIYIAVVDISKFNLGHAYPLYYKNLLKSAERTFKYAACDNFVTFIFSSDDSPPNVVKSLHTLKRILERNNMSIGVSSGFENLYTAKKHFTEAVDALHTGVKLNAHKRIHLYSELS